MKRVFEVFLQLQLYSLLGGSPNLLCEGKSQTVNKGGFGEQKGDLI